ncbi:MAG: hypothetical protein GX960_00715 [Actinomycetales bacterium]|nr:hypothetical protein [Actinomycetales bacterium]
MLREARASTVPVHVDHGTSVQVRLRWEDSGRRGLHQGEDHTPSYDLDGTFRG